MKTAILSLAGLMALGVTGAAVASTTNTCAIVKHHTVHRTLARNTVVRQSRRVRVLASEARATIYDRPAEVTRVYEQDYVEAPPPPPVYYEDAYPAPYGPVVVGYVPRWHGRWGYRRGWRGW